MIFDTSYMESIFRLAFEYQHCHLDSFVANRLKALDKKISLTDNEEMNAAFQIKAKVSKDEI